MKERFARRGVLATGVSLAALMILTSPASTQTAVGARSAAALRAPQRAQPSAAHLQDAYTAAEAIFSMQRAGQDDPSLVELREGLEDVRARAREVVARRRASQLASPRAHSQRSRVLPPPAETTAAEAELRAALNRLRVKIESARMRSRGTGPDAELLRNALRKAGEVEAEVGESLDMAGHSGSTRLAELANRLEIASRGNVRARKTQASLGTAKHRTPRSIADLRARGLVHAADGSEGARPAESTPMLRSLLPNSKYER